MAELIIGIGPVLQLICEKLRENRPKPYRIILTQKVKKPNGQETEETVIHEFETEEEMAEAIRSANRRRSIRFAPGVSPQAIGWGNQGPPGLEMLPFLIFPPLAILSLFR